jgi:hypothetical protein
MRKSVLPEPQGAASHFREDGALTACGSGFDVSGPDLTLMFKMDGFKKRHKLEHLSAFTIHICISLNNTEQVEKEPQPVC